MAALPWGVAVGTARVGNGYLSVLRAASLDTPEGEWSATSRAVSVDGEGRITVEIPAGETPKSFLKVCLSAKQADQKEKP